MGATTGYLPAIFFYLFSAVTVGSAFMVIASRNPVHSVLFLILAFVNASGLFMLAGAEFLAMLLIVVYVGAVAVLFLFVVMMLDVDFAELREGFLQYLPVGMLVGMIVLIELLMVIGTFLLAPGAAADAVQPIPDMAQVSNIRGARRHSLHQVRLPLPDGRHDPAGGDDRRDRADAAPQGKRSPAGCRKTGGPHAGDGNRGRQGRTGQGDLTRETALRGRS